MAVRPTLVKAAKATLVAFAFVIGSALVAPGFASAAPVSHENLSAPSDLEPIEGPIVVAPGPIFGAPGPVVGAWVCFDSPWQNGTGVDFDCTLQAGVTVTATIFCSDGRVYSRQVWGPGRFGFSLWCRGGAWVTNYTVTD